VQHFLPISLEIHCPCRHTMPSNNLMQLNSCAIQCSSQLFLRLYLASPSSSRSRPDAQSQGQRSDHEFQAMSRPAAELHMRGGDTPHRGKLDDCPSAQPSAQPIVQRGGSSHSERRDFGDRGVHDSRASRPSSDLQVGNSVSLHPDELHFPLSLPVSQLPMGIRSMSMVFLSGTSKKLRICWTITGSSWHSTSREARERNANEAIIGCCTQSLSSGTKGTLKR